MVDFEGYYSFPAEQVECVRASASDSEEYPYRLTAFLKSGRELSMNYKTKEARDNAKRLLCADIARELGQGGVDIRNKLFLLSDTLRRMDQRQLRIWRQLKQLLPIPGEDGGEQDLGGGED